MAKIKVTDLIQDDKNFNKGSEYGQGLIQKSFEKFGAGRSILIDKNNKIIAGNKSTENYGAGGGQDVIVVESDGTQLIAVKRTDIDLDTPQGREMALADNATAKANIVWAEDVIASEIGVEVAESWGVDMGKEVPEAEEDDFDTTPPEIPITVLGDLYEIGEHKLLCGDSTDSDQVAKLMNGERWDLIVTDPPYNVAYEGKTKDALTIQNDRMTDSNFIQFLTDYFKTALLNTKKGGGIYVFFADMELRNFVNAFLDGGFKLSQQLIWLKQSMVMGRKDYHCKHEPILYGWYEGEAHNWYSDRKQTTILEFDRPQRNGEHPTMKPIQLLSYLITNSSKSGDLIGDGFLGSGSTMVASHQLKRKCYGMELDPKYCDVIIRRMINLDPTLVIKRNGEVTKDFNEAK
jgi:site-specific DNA-methyltransferase (adenine-specific)